MADASAAAGGEDGATILVPTPDGRRLAVCQWGDPAGSGLFVLHGTPGSRFLRHTGHLYSEQELRVITYDRPGYGLSTPSTEQTAADAAADVATIADALNLEQFGVLGVSSGGPRALATAALLPERVTRCATVVSGAPFTADDLDFYVGMDDEDRAAWEAAAEGGDALDADADDTLAWVRSGLPGVPSDDEDGLMLRATFAEAFRQGVVGYREDRLALVRDWGFPVGAVRVPTRIMVGTDDRSVPEGHWHWLETRIPDAVVVPVPGGHLGPRKEPEAELVAWAGSRSVASMERREGPDATR